MVIIIIIQKIDLYIIKCVHIYHIINSTMKTLMWLYSLFMLYAYVSYTYTWYQIYTDFTVTINISSTLYGGAILQVVKFDKNFTKETPCLGTFDCLSKICTLTSIQGWGILVSPFSVCKPDNVGDSNPDTYTAILNLEVTVPIVILICFLVTFCMLIGAIKSRCAKLFIINWLAYTIMAGSFLAYVCEIFFFKERFQEYNGDTFPASTLKQLLGKICLDLFIVSGIHVVSYRSLYRKFIN